MTVAKGSALALGFAGAVALGVWIGPHITHREGAVADRTAPAASAPVASADDDLAAREAKHRPTVRRAVERPRKAAGSSSATPIEISVIAPALHEQLQPLLNKGADMGLASEDFGNAEQFATVAHAARNTAIPFVLLKHRVLYEHRSLKDAIHEFKPDLNAAEQVHRARAQAESDLSALEG